jgi:hypothetical protein
VNFKDFTPFAGATKRASLRGCLATTGIEVIQTVQTVQILQKDT